MELKTKEVQNLEMQWELLKFELNQMEKFYELSKTEEEIHVVHDIQSLISKLENGEYL